MSNFMKYFLWGLVPSIILVLMKAGGAPGLVLEPWWVCIVPLGISMVLLFIVAAIAAR